jgi:hypothetical protein
MATEITSNAYTFNGLTYFINCDKDKPCYSEYIKTIIKQVNAMLTYHSKLFMVRYDFRSKQRSDNNEDFLNFFDTIKKKIKTTYGLVRIGYIWCREHGAKNGGLHYHFVLLIDGHKINYPDKLSRLIEGDFALYGGSVGYVPNCFLNLKRGDQQTIGEAIYRVSYLAKVNTKSGNRKQNVKRFGASKIKIRLIYDKIAVD